MLLLPAACVAGLLAGVACGGRLEGVSARPPRCLLVLGAAGVTGALAAHERVIVLWLVSSGMIVVFATANLRRAGMPLILLGALSNLLVVAANGGMPVAADTAEAIGYSAADIVEDGVHEIETSASQLSLLDDRLVVRELRQIVSVGDLFLAAGAWIFTFSASRGAGRRGVDAPRGSGARRRARRAFLSGEQGGVGGSS